MRPIKMDASAQAVALGELGEWKKLEGREAIRREFLFADFNAAFAFMCRVAMMAERMDHHPEWSNTYNRVTVILSTHDAGGVTELDIQLAKFCDAAFVKG